MSHLVKCRICKQKFDTDATTEWIMPSTNYYYHLKCYQDFGKKTKDIYAELEDDLWFQACWDFLRKDLKVNLNFQKVKSQWDNFLKKKMTAKGIFFCLKYFYDVQKGAVDRAEGGIGIVPYIYTQSCEYWAQREQREVGICQKIEDQIRANFDREKIQVTQKKHGRKAITIDFDAIEQEGCDDY